VQRVYVLQVVLTWTVQDAAGNMAAKSQTIGVLLPLVAPPPPVVVPGSPPPPEGPTPRTDITGLTYSPLVEGATCGGVSFKVGLPAVTDVRLVEVAWGDRAISRLAAARGKAFVVARRAYSSIGRYTARVKLVRRSGSPTSLPPLPLTVVPASGERVGVLPGTARGSHRVDHGQSVDHRMCTRYGCG
jgi:hypothetical protein